MQRGERAPDFVLPRPGGGAARFYAGAGGRPALLVFCPTPDDPAVGAALEAARAAAATVHVVARNADAGVGGAEVFVDLDGRVTASYRLDPEGAATTLTLDPNLRVSDGLETRQERPAPVLYVPDVLDVQARSALIGVWAERGHVETGVERSAGERREDAVEPTAKRRRDHTVSDPELLRSLTAAVGRRVMPELRKAFAYRATRFEGFKIACYEADSGGFFTAHRDNLSPATAHRTFALTLNLNDDYEGGELRFPEYGTLRYRPAAGEALLFSCSHLHEVLPVTSGRRFVLLSFLFGDEVQRSSQSPGKGRSSADISSSPSSSS